MKRKCITRRGQIFKSYIIVPADLIDMKIIEQMAMRKSKGGYFSVGVSAPSFCICVICHAYMQRSDKIAVYEGRIDINKVCV